MPYATIAVQSLSSISDDGSVMFTEMAREGSIEYIQPEI